MWNTYHNLNIKERITLSYSCIIMTVLFLTLIFTFVLCYRALKRSVDDNLMNIALSVSQNPYVIKALEKNEPGRQLTTYCDSLLASAHNIDIITICNSQGIRLYHRNKQNIGKRLVGGDDGPMLSNHTNYFSTAEGTLGVQRRYFCVVNDASGKFIGFIVTSVLEQNISSIKERLVTSFSIIAVIALIAIALVARHLHDRLQHSLLGYEPEQIAQLIIQHQEFLDSLEEGILAIDKDSHVILLNAAAVQMLAITDPHPEGKPVLDVFPESLLPHTLTTKAAEQNVSLKLHNIALITSRIPVIEHGELIGAVSIFRSRQQVTELSEKLTGVSHMVDAMRAYTHEFKNKLHIILGMLQFAKREEIAEYITDITTLEQSTISSIIATCKIPRISALLIGKTLKANELNISLTIDKNSHVEDGEQFLPIEGVTTIIGNLVENAIESINGGSMEVREVRISLFYDDSVFFLSVSDTGRGIPPEVMSHIYEKGFSTKGKGRGTGLSLIKDLVDSYKGDIQVTSEEGNGTDFTISIENKNSKRRNRHV